MGDASPSMLSSSEKRAWVTLITRSSYMPGAILLAQSLYTQNSAYPLLILTTPSFPSSLIPVLSHEATLTNSSLLSIDDLSPPTHNKPASLIASRFEDTWTKLRVFELHKHGYDKLVFLDADMLVLQNMDELFEIDLPQNWIAANHVCACNLDHDSWAPESWTKENCAYTGLKSSGTSAPVPAIRPEESVNAWSIPRRLLNGGMFIFTPYQQQWEQMIEFLNTDIRVREFLFPDQDFLAAFFADKWKSVGWQYNALKTMRYWHKHMWDDAKVKNVHYIVDKPWSKRVGSDGIAGYLGRDGITHTWWWQKYESWVVERDSMKEVEIVNMMRNEVAQPLAET